VGVVSSAKQVGLTDAQATGAVYYPYTRHFDSDLFVVARTVLPPDSLAGSLRQAVRDVDADLGVSDLRSMDARIEETLVARRSPPVLAALFAGIALLLTGIGTYGVMSYAVVQRRREIALRMALGASPEQVRRQFVSLGLHLVAAGSALGLAGAWTAGRAMQTLLFGVPAVHVPTLAAAAVIMLAISLAASLLPSRRAAYISPMGGAERIVKLTHLRPLGRRPRWRDRGAEDSAASRPDRRPPGPRASAARRGRLRADLLRQGVSCRAMLTGLVNPLGSGSA
jgi:predicted lysophospholipase L1 biosynthesis ABC-type transport system permease subunit